MAKNYLRLDRVGGQDHYESFVSDEITVNGQLVNVGKADLDYGIDIVEITSAEEGKRPDAVVTNVYIDYGYLDYDESEQELKPGKPGRALRLSEGQILSWNVENATGLAAGDLVTTGVGGKGLKKATALDEVIGVVTRLDYLAYVGDLVVVRIEKNGLKGE